MNSLEEKLASIYDVQTVACWSRGYERAKRHILVAEYAQSYFVFLEGEDSIVHIAENVPYEKAMSMAQAIALFARAYREGKRDAE